jgi:hypothetical protein
MKVLKDNGIDGQSMIGELRKSGASYVGPSAVEFVAYLESRFSLSIDDIINGTKFKTLERSQQLRLIGDLKSKYPDFKFDDKKSYDNVEKLLKVCDEDFISEWILATLKVATFTEAQNPMGYAFMKREWVREIGKKAVAKNK